MTISVDKLKLIKGSTDAFITFYSKTQSIACSDVDGISITLGTVSTYVWNYAADLRLSMCHYSQSQSSSICIGNDYYYESGDVGTSDGASYYPESTIITCSTV